MLAWGSRVLFIGQDMARHGKAWKAVMRQMVIHAGMQLVMTLVTRSAVEHAGSSEGIHPVSLFCVSLYYVALVQLGRGQTQ